MPTTLVTTPEIAALMLDLLLDQIDIGATVGSVQIYAEAGAIPDIADAATGTLLAFCTIGAHDAPDPAFDAAAGDPVEAAGDVSVGWFAKDISADGTGTATYFRVCNKDGEAVLQGSVGATGSGSAMELDNTSIVSGAVVTISSCVVSFTGVYA